MKVGIDQANKPAPLWFRRLRDGAVNFLLPALGQLVASLNLTDAQENMWLQVLTFLPAAFNFVAVLLGDDAKRKLRVWVLLIGCTAFLSGCRTVAEIAKADAIKAARARQKEMVALEKVRKELPCIPLKIIQGQTVYLPGDSIPCTSGKCPPVGVRVDTLPVLDEAALKAVRDSLEQVLYITGLKDAHILQLQANYNYQLKRSDDQAAKAAYWRKRFLIGVGLLSSGVTVWLLLAGKLTFIPKIFSWLISKFR